jgi:hypothetical protein
MPPKESKPKPKETSDQMSRRHWTPRLKVAKGLIEEVPLLVWNSHSAEATNLPEFEASIAAYVGTQWASLNSIFTQDAYQIPLEPHFDREEALNSEEPKALIQRKFFTRYDLWLKQKHVFDQDKVKVYNAIRGNMSQESIERVEADPFFTSLKIRETQDPLEFWRLIKKTHVRGRTGNEVVDQINVEEMFNNIRMRQNESAVEFKTRFERALKAREHARLENIDANRQAVLLIRKADDVRFGELKKQLHNASILGQSSYPNDLAGALHLLSNYQVTKANGHVTHATVFTVKGTNSSGVNGRSKHSNKKKSGNSNPQPGGSQDGAENTRPSASSGPVNRSKNGKPTCLLCGSAEHFARDCSELSYCRNMIRHKSDSSKVNMTRSVTSMNIDNADAGEWGSSIFMTSAVCFPAGSIDLAEWDLLLDPQADAHISRSLEFFWNGVSDSPYTVAIGGINGGAPIITRQSGRFLDAIDDVMYHPDATANILSWSRLRDAHPEIRRWNDDDKDEFYMKIPSRPVMVFKRKGGLYVCDTRDYSFISRAYTTVVENESRFTAAEVIGAKTARDVQQRLGYMPPSSMIDIINSGAIINMPITAHDVKRSVMIYGDSPAMLKGRAKTAKAPSMRAALDVTPPVVSGIISSVITMCVDIMFCFGQPFLLSVGMPLSLAIGTALTNKSASAVAKGLNEHMALYSRYLFTVRRVRSDRDGAIMASAAQFPTVEFIASAAGAHDPLLREKLNSSRQLFVVYSIHCRSSCRGSYYVSLCYIAFLLAIYHLAKVDT